MARLQPVPSLWPQCLRAAARPALRSPRPHCSAIGTEALCLSEGTHRSSSHPLQPLCPWAQPKPHSPGTSTFLVLRSNYLGRKQGGTVLSLGQQCPRSPRQTQMHCDRQTWAWTWASNCIQFLKQLLAVLAWPRATAVACVGHPWGAGLQLPILSLLYAPHR